MQREKTPEWREKQKGSRGIRRGQRYRLVFQFPIRELKDAVTEYIEYYNSRRISLKLKGLTPIEYRNQTYMPRV
ncbi:IS150 conserved protein InsB [Escherichia coli]|nr:IS150 conserved protein InsB [Escherichia coli]